MTSREDVTPKEIPGPTRKAVLWRTVKEFQADGITDWAAALTYYAVLALFPALIALTSLLGLFGNGPATVNSVISVLSTAGAPPKTVDAVRSAIEGVVSNRSGAGIAFVLGLLLALNAASGYVGAFFRASNAIYETGEGRPIWKLRPLQILVTLAMIVMLVVILVGIVVSGKLAKAVGDQVGLGSTFVTVYGIAKWPVILALFVLMLAVLYYAAPNARLPKFRWISPGAVVALVGWVLATVAFFFYVTNFGSYNKTYGSLGIAISLLVWLWITNIAILFGQELNAEIERGREITAGLPAMRELQLAPRDEPKDPDEAAARTTEKALDKQSREADDDAGDGAGDRPGDLVPPKRH